jgi:hypothetical protein
LMWGVHSISTQFLSLRSSQSPPSWWGLF